jgi:hypothetical protein
MYNGERKGPVIWIPPKLYDTIQYIVYNLEGAEDDTITYSLQDFAYTKGATSCGVVQTDVVNHIMDIIYAEMRVDPNIKCVLFSISGPPRLYRLVDRNGPVEDNLLDKLDLDKYLGLLFHYNGVCMA